jgi:flavodoxin
MEKIMVAYFSRSGYTRGVAEQLARLLKAQLCPIEEPRSRSGPLGYVRSLWEATRGRDADISTPAQEPEQFDLVVIGTPIWGWHLSSPARAFAHRYGGKIKHVAFFCTMGGAGAEKAFGELEKLIGHSPVATLALTDKELDSGTANEKIDRFVEMLRLERVAL